MILCCNIIFLLPQYQNQDICAIEQKAKFEEIVFSNKAPWLATLHYHVNRCAIYPSSNKQELQRNWRAGKFLPFIPSGNKFITKLSKESMYLHFLHFKTNCDLRAKTHTFVDGEQVNVLFWLQGCWFSEAEIPKTPSRPQFNAPSSFVTNFYEPERANTGSFYANFTKTESRKEKHAFWLQFLFATVKLTQPTVSPKTINSDVRSVVPRLHLHRWAKRR